MAVRGEGNISPDAVVLAGTPSIVGHAGSPDVEQATTPDELVPDGPPSSSERSTQSIEGNETPTKPTDQSMVETQSNNGTSPKTLRRKRKATREALLQAWTERESARKRAAGSSSLEYMLALEATTVAYINKRAELAQHMSSSELTEEDAKAFPVLSKHDLSAPRSRPKGA